MFTRTFALLLRLFIIHSPLSLFTSFRLSRTRFYSIRRVQFLFCFVFTSVRLQRLRWMDVKSEFQYIWSIEFLLFLVFLVSLFVSYKFFKLQLKTVFFLRVGLSIRCFFSSELIAGSRYNRIIWSHFLYILYNEYIMSINHNEMIVSWANTSSSGFVKRERGREKKPTANEARRKQRNTMYVSWKFRVPLNIWSNSLGFIE